MKKRNNKLEKKRIENSKLPISEHAVLEISFDDDLGFFFDFFLVIKVRQTDKQRHRRMGMRF